MAKEERADLSFREESGFWWFCRAGSRRGWLQADVAKEDGGLRAGGVGSRGFSGGICLGSFSIPIVVEDSQLASPVMGGVCLGGSGA